MKSRVRLIVICLVVGGTIGWFSGYSHPESIRSFSSDIVIEEDGSAEVTETIKYDFGGNHKQGIYREIPTVYVKDGTWYDFDIRIRQVARDAGNNKFIEEAHIAERDKRNYILKIGDPEKTHTGIQTYVITYTIDEAVIPGETQDTVHLNINGGGWVVPIDSLSVNFISKKPATDFSCFKDKQVLPQCGSEIETVSGKSLKVNDLKPRENIAIIARYGSGSFPAYAGVLPDKKVDFIKSAELLDKNSEQTFNFFIKVGAPTVVLMILLALVGPYLQRYLRRRHEIIVTQYAPPDDLSPAEAGLLLDSEDNIMELTATLIDLAIRGYIKIIEVKHPRLWSKGEYKLLKLKPFDDLRDFEKKLMNAIFGNKKETNLNDLNPERVSGAITRVSELLEKRLVDQELYSFKSPSRLIKFMKKHPFLTVFWPPLLIVVLLLISDYTGSTVVAFAAAISFPLYFLPLLAWGLHLTIVNKGTNKGYKQWALLEGFRVYLSSVEKDRIKAENAPGASREKFMEYLPYAIALGVDKEWAKQFRGLELGAVDWLVMGSVATYSYARFSDSLSRGLVKNINSTYGTGISRIGSGISSGGGGSW